MDNYSPARLKMVSEQVEARGVHDPRVLAAMRSIPRHLFVPPSLQFQAYEDFPLPIGYGQTISQPYIVGLMTELLSLTGTESVLEIGTGSGYQTAILAYLAQQVVTIERIPALCEQPKLVFTQLNIRNVECLCDDGSQGWQPHAPYDAILVNFAPIAKNRAKLINAITNEEIDILIATDCISEGQNLQDCDYLVNYDIHWNPVRIIQRFGRIDRLGSINKAIQLVNFWPTKDLDNYINLKERVEARMALVDVTATGEDNILNTEQLQELIADDLKYRNKQLRKLKEEVLDLEEMDETISLTDFTLDDFRIELLHFLEGNRKRLQDSPLGLYALVPAPGGEYAALNKDRAFTVAEKEIIKPGIIFCLSQKGQTDGNEEVNPLNPYFLVYVRDDGTVRYNYTHAKQILEIYRLLCQGSHKPYDILCALFNAETENSTNMDKYTDLLKKAVDQVVHVFKKKSNQKLTSDRGALLIPKAKQLNEMNDFELVTWLIVR